MNVMITGATSGIGNELALMYAKQGDSVIACGRNQQNLDDLTMSNPAITPLCFDLTDYHHYPNIDDEIDVLIFNAGDCRYIDNALEFDGKLFADIININLISVGYGIERWIKNIKKGGRVVFISSSAGLLPLPRAEAYGASKAALTYLAQTLAVTLKKHDINVTVVHPGFVDTPLTQRNTFPMPMIIDRHQAAEKIIQGIEKGKSEINCPFLFVFIMKCLRYLPSALWQRVATRMS
ncbi:SDR family NAD(P)-dependent oxidoreductase [Vibrio sinensis]|uniref:SDR family NAD(P)-dependent oxidoreductase n=1 Tax=Vibrio sinensis TaxID=2302434 RepID=A0A3A6QQY2_9VIBR|nr:SDR family NAD(P)-dependent oxidoreductase [Vibrio sinensis]RJX73678.1 SDR family NAD(P)-dependent oxidoreductase [Vibrio sinensis]